MKNFSSWKTACRILVVCAATAVGSLAQTVTTLVRFNGTDGSAANGLTHATDGNYYGTTQSGGASANCSGGCGTIFKITPGGVLTSLHSFDFTDGARPLGGLIQARDGNFYGTTSEGGAGMDCVNGCGTVFKITADGTFATLQNFEFNEGGVPEAGLVEGTDGNFYGTTYAGGAFSQMCQGDTRCGTVFKITPEGVVTTLHSFTGQSNEGANPQAGLIQASDGNFYGTTSEGGTFTVGTVFKISPDGTLTSLHSFELTDGLLPMAGLIQATDGNFYGTTEGGGSGTSRKCFVGCGTVFKVTPGGVLTTLHNFNFVDGAEPVAGLIQGRDGNFYGTTGGGGTGNECVIGCGTIFEITPEGKLDSLHSFNSTDGFFPLAGLLQAADGNLYGTTASTAFTFPVVVGVTLPSAVSFGDTVINTTSSANTVPVLSNGSVMLQITSITASANFEVSSTSCGATLAAGKKCGVVVRMIPGTPGKVTGTLSFTDNAPNSPQTVALSGYGIEPATLFPGSVTFTGQTLRTYSPPKTFTLSNHQAVALNNIRISATGDFVVGSRTCTTSLGPKSKCRINIVFRPKATGTLTGELSVTDSAANSPQSASLTGTGK
jgi:uncharacterized repeat protein (TIGR03803 family)